MNDTNTGQQETLIIRRGGSPDLDAPKGGVWKIAYADFMTAMMAFFLVMWLINATGETTRTGIANYFNPIKLSDGMDLPRKGLRDPDRIETEAADQAAHEEPAPDAKDGRAETEPSPGRATRRAEQALFRDPYAVLAAIAARAEAEAISGLDAGAKAPGATGELDRIGNQPHRDPFDPPVRAPASQQPEISPEVPSSENEHQPAGPARSPHETGTRRGRSAEDSGKLATGGALAAVERARMAGDAPRGSTSLATGNDADTGEPSGASGLADRLLQRLTKGTAAHPTPNVTVRSGDDGVLISLSDQADFGMFAIGSAEPLPETMAAMEKIADVLTDLPGKVIIRGHTDARPFRSDKYGNWRLSAARAHMAYAMLVRGGLDEDRVLRIEGHADRALKQPGDPQAAGNRRIEILVQEAAS